MYRERITFRLTPRPGTAGKTGGSADDGDSVNGNSWNVRYVLSDENWGESTGRLVQPAADGGYVELRSPKGFKARLHLSVQHWNDSRDGDRANRTLQQA